MLKKLFKLLKNRRLKRFLNCIRYSYSSYLVYDFINRIGGYKKEKYQVFNSIGYYPDFKNPESFNEKILWKKFYDRNPLLPIVSDKYRVREYLKNFLGPAESEKILTNLLFVTDSPASIPFDTLPDEYIIKPNHASGWLIIAENIDGQKKITIIYDNKKTVLYDCSKTRAEIINTCNDWLSKAYGFSQFEWAYQQIKRKIIIEKFLRGKNGNPPDEYKLTVFNGKCNSITVCHERFGNKSSSRYKPDWSYVNVLLNENIKQAEYESAPEKLQSMIDLAEKIGKAFDYIRVDLHLLDGEVYFGELTNYAASGKINFKPISYDFDFGSNWKINPGYWRKQK